MSRASRDSDSGELSSEQRLALLEGKVSTNRTLLMVILLAALVAVSITGTVLVVKMTSPQVNYADAQQLSQIEQQLQKLEQQLKQYQQQRLATEQLLEQSTAGALKQQFLAQEQSYQAHLKALKQGMRDLAHMIPGSRTWLEIYNEQMDAALNQSRQRHQQLEQLSYNAQP